MELVKPSRGSRVFGSRGATVFELWKRDQCKKKKKYIPGDRMWARRGDERGDDGDDGGGKVGNDEREDNDEDGDDEQNDFGGDK